VVDLIESLPRSLRRSLAHGGDAAELADLVTKELPFGKGSLVDAIAEKLAALSGVGVPSEAFKLDQLRAHHRLLVRVLDEKGREVARGRDVAEIRKRLGVKAGEREGCGHEG
jgi:ATP-dependent helicase HrpA